MKNKKLDQKIIRYILLIAGVILFILHFQQIMAIGAAVLGIIQPLIVGFVFAYILNILMKKLERWYFPQSRRKIVLSSRRPVSLLAAILIIILIIFLVIRIVLPQVINTFATIIAELPQLVDHLNRWINDNSDYFPVIAERIGQFNLNWDSLFTNIADHASKGISSFFSTSFNFISIFTSGLFNLFVAFVFAIYLLLSKEKLIGQLERIQAAFFKESFRRRTKYLLAVANESFTNYIAGQFTEAVILGSLCTLGMWIFRFPYATTIGVFVGVTALIPVVGAYLGAGVGLFLIVMADPLQALFFLIYIIILQQLENNLIYPRVVGTSVGLPGIVVFVAVIIGGGLLGIPGMLLGVPTAATVYKILQAETRKRLPP